MSDSHNTSSHYYYGRNKIETKVEINNFLSDCRYFKIKHEQHWEAMTPDERAKRDEVMNKSSYDRIIESHERVAAECSRVRRTMRCN